MDKAILKCIKCKSQYLDLSQGTCSACGGILLVQYAPEALRDGQNRLLHQREIKGISSFEPVLPDIKKDNWVTLQECNTPYIEGKHVREELGIHSLWMKDETRNPTGSFKDRAIALCVSAALELGVKRVVVASSGNGAASSAAYGARAGIPVTVAVPRGTPAGKVIHAQTCRGSICRIPGKFDKSYEYAKEMAKEPGTMNLTTTFLSPLAVEGYKTMAYEIYMQAGNMPDYVFIPVGAGPVLYGIYKGFEELCMTGRLKTIPRLAAVQSEQCAPIVRAWRTGGKTVGWENPGGIASAIADPLLGYEDNGDLTVKAIKGSGGLGLTVSDEEILAAGKLLAGKEGIFVEPSSAAALAGVMKAKAENFIDSSHDIAVLLTGSGLKDPGKYEERGHK